MFEFDGRLKYRRKQDGGLAEVDEAEIVWFEKQRQDWVCGFKLGMSRVVWADVQEATWQATQDRLHREMGPEADARSRLCERAW